MPLEKITERILKEAEKEAQRILIEARREAAEILKKAENDAAVLKKDIVSLAQKEAKEVKGRLLSSARLEARNLVLHQKQKGVEDVFKQSLETILSFNDSEYKQVFEKILLKNVVAGDEEIIISPRDTRRISDAFLLRVNQTLKKRGIKGNLKLSKETRDIKGGFILKSDGVEINNSFTARLKFFREQLESQVLRILLKEHVN